jgi:hypothetical protein
MVRDMRYLWLLALLLAGCGGSASETPWPVEPLNTEPGPAGEELSKGNVLDVKSLPNTYTPKGGAKKGAGGGEPADDDLDVDDKDKDEDEDEK